MSKRTKLTPEERKKRKLERDNASRRTRRANPAYRDKDNERQRARYATDPEYRAIVDARNMCAHHARRANPEWVAKERVRGAEWMRQRRADPTFRAKENERDREWHKLQLQTNPEYRAKKYERVIRRLATKKNRTPVWANHAVMATFYKNCPPGHHVDHFYPLQGREVSGLHVIENLRYLPASENARKRNSMPRVQIFHLPTAEEIRRLDRRAKPQTKPREWNPRSAETSAEMSCHG